MQVHVCIGGKRVSDDIHTFEAGVQIVSGTPGRVFHMIQPLAGLQCWLLLSPYAVESQSYQCSSGHDRQTKQNNSLNPCTTHMSVGHAVPPNQNPSGSGSAISAHATSRCWFWMKPMRCSTGCPFRVPVFFVYAEIHTGDRRRETDCSLIVLALELP